jgi:hypothetical protein
VSVRTTIANKAEIHEMKMDGDVMKMRAINGIDNSERYDSSAAIKTMCFPLPGPSPPG